MEVDRDRLDLRDDPGVISPPTVDPAWKCGTVVVVRGFIAEADLDVEVDGIAVATGVAGGFPVPNGARIGLANPLNAGAQIRARQTLGGAVSDWSALATARDHTVEYPAGPPRPEINPAPVYRCGTRTGVFNLLAGCDVWIDANAVEVGRVTGAGTNQGVNVNPPYQLAQSVVARASLCKDPSPPSAVQVAQPPPAPLPVPTFLPVYAGGKQLTVTNVVNGARLTLSRNAIVQFSFSSWGYQHHVSLNPEFSTGEVISVTQQLCPDDPPSGDGSTIVLTCSMLPAPGVEPVQTGAHSVTLTSFVSDARIKVFVNGVKTGDGSGPVVQLTEPVQGGDTIDVWQIVGSCAGRTVRELTVQCVAPGVGDDPSARDLFPVGTTSYNAGTMTVTSGHAHVVGGTIFYPADADGADTAFNGRLAALGRTPIAVLVHGRHGGTTSHLGYSYLQQQLARMGIIAASVDCNQSDSWGGWADNIRDRADLVIESIRHVQSLDSGGHPIFGGHCDFSKLALMGHSRGGDAVVLVPEIIALPGVVIQGVISLGPVNSGASTGHPRGHAFMAILPASDGDVVDNNGAQFYDAADPAPFKSQLYVDHANHNFFNREWTNDDTNGGLPLMARADHERILSTYGCAFLRAVLLGHSTEGFLAGTVRPPAVHTENVHLSYKLEGQLTIDDHEDRNGITVNSVGMPTAQSGGLVADEYSFAQGGGSYNASFFGNTLGMIAQSDEASGEFRSELDHAYDMRRRQLWIRVAQVYNGSSVPPGTTGFGLGLEDANGIMSWIGSDGVGGVPRPLDRRVYDLAQYYATDKTKTIPTTMRFPIRCFRSRPGTAKRFDVRHVVAVHLKLDRGDRHALAFDDLQIVDV